MQLNSYRELKVWQVGMQLAKEIYLLTDTFPKSETYGLSSQVQRSATSVPANLAEGHAKNSTKDFLRHISIAQGSLAETETHLLLAESLGYAKSDQIAVILNKCAEERRMLSGLRRSLRAKLTPDPCPLTPVP
jgi:four helix bundle protein